MNTPPCEHLSSAEDVKPSGDGCVECLADGGRWVHLRLCENCGHIGCCDSSPGKHASAHARAENHPLVQSFEPGEDWWWCYVDEVAFRVPDAPTYSHS
jgi:Zn-finger in ubiquitin-hydrolases and other protein